MFKSPLEASTQSFEQTAIFVENIFDTVKKAKAAKAAAKSLAESKLVTSYDYSSFGELSPVKKKKPRKNAKKSAKVKATTPKKKTTPLRKPKTPKDSPEKRKKASSPAKSPRKYTKRVPKAPATNDIDDEEAAFILSSISQRSFDSFYNRLNSCEPNKFHIELSPTYTNGCPSTVTDPVKNLAYYVMLDHNYWIVEPEVQPVKEPEKVEPIKVDVAPALTSPVTSLATPMFVSPAKAPEIALKTEPEVKVDYTTQASVIRNEAPTYNELPVKSKLSTDLKPSVTFNHVPSVITNETVAKPEISKREDVKPMEVNNNKFPSSPESDSPKQETFKSESTSVKKRWLRQAASDMKAPVKKRKTAFFEAIDAAAEEEHSESKLTNGFCTNSFSSEPMKNGIDKPLGNRMEIEELLLKPVEEVQKAAVVVPEVVEPIAVVQKIDPVLKQNEPVQKFTEQVQKPAEPLRKPAEKVKKPNKRALKQAEPAKKSVVRGKKVQKAIESKAEAPVRSKRVKQNNFTSPAEEIVQSPVADVAVKPPLEVVTIKAELEALMAKEEEAIIGEAKAANCSEGKEEAKASLETGKSSVKVGEEDKIVASIDDACGGIKSEVKTELHENFKAESAAIEVDTKVHVTLAHQAEQVELKSEQRDLKLNTASPVIVQTELKAEAVQSNGCAPESNDDEDDSRQWEIVMDFHRLQLKQLELNNKKFTDAQNKSLCDTNGRTPNSNHYDPLMPSLESGRLPLISSRFGLFQQERIPPPAEDPRKPFRSSLSLEASQFAPNVTPSPFQRSISETSITKRNRWSNNTAVTATPFNSHSAMPFGSYYNESQQIKRDEPYVSSYNTYRSQKSAWINNKGAEPSPWEAQKEFAPIAYRTESFLTSYAGISDKPSLLSTIKADEQISAIQKKTLTKTNIPLTKPKPSACDPRLNPSLQQEARKDDSATPKKKVWKLFFLLENFQKFTQKTFLF